MNAIKIKDVHKEFKIYPDKGLTMKDKLLFRSRNRYEKREVLKGVSFEVEKGEAIGLIGHNGCGKSTLLKLMTKILFPTSGSIDIKGRVSSLLELGAGFHPDMTGRENIYSNASIFGLSKKDIDKRLGGIIEFSELSDYIDSPVRTYSSGMYMRLAFSVAINVDADVLLIDEILAVGDAAFQSKCFDRLMSIKGNGTTIVIVSHSLSQIEEICERSIWLDDGKIRLMGSPNKVHPEYMEFMGHKKRSAAASENKTKQKDEEKDNESELTAKITSIKLLDADGAEKENFRSGEEATLKISYEADPEKTDGALVGILIYRMDNVQCYGTNTQRERIPLIKLEKRGDIYCKFEKLNLVKGSYYIDVALRSKDMFAYDYWQRGVSFGVFSTIDEVGIARLEHSWTF